MREGVLVANEDELVVVVPAVLLHVDAGFEVRHGPARSARAAGPRKLEAVLLQHVESLFDERVLEEEARRVAVAEAVVRVTTLVQSLAEDVTTQRHAATHEDARQLPELDVRQTVPAEGEAASVAHRDEARGSASARTWARARLVLQQLFYCQFFVKTHIIKFNVHTTMISRSRDYFKFAIIFNENTQIYVVIVIRF